LPGRFPDDWRPMPGDTNGADIQPGGPDSGSALPGHDQANAVLRLLTNLEHILLYIAAFAVLVVGAAVLVASTASILFHHASWTGRLLPTSPVATRQQLWDLAVDAGAAFVLVVALAIARRSAQRTDIA
jgi:cytochrome b561